MDNIIKCPMHDWKFDARVGHYTNVQLAKKELTYNIVDENLVVKLSHDEPQLPSTKQKLKIQVTYLSHACLLVETEEVSFITDPWIIGFAFASGWWPKAIPPKNWKNIVNSVDFIYISHNHPDHLNLFTLEHVRKDMEFIVPKFNSDSVSKILIKRGFDNVFEAHFQNYYQYKKSALFLTIFKSGDFRDDSGLYFTYGDFSFLSTVDSNNLNFQKFPKNITLFASVFTSGASGYPLCFDTVNDADKSKIIQRNRKSSKATVRGNIKRCNARFYMPYAGFFTEKAKRDSYILHNNIKNCVEDYKDIEPDVSLLNINEFDSYLFVGCDLHNRSTIRRSGHDLENPELTIKKIFSNYSYNANYVQRYFENCGFQKELVLYLSLTNSDFSKVKNCVVVDFRLSQTRVEFLKFNWQHIKKDHVNKGHSYNLLHIRVRQDSFLWVINNRMSWEDLSIGFQCRIDRVPNIYNVDFWHHFTNVYN